MVWGLAHSSFVTVAFFITVTGPSYAAFPWCANPGTQTARIPASNESAISLVFIRFLFVGLLFSAAFFVLFLRFLVDVLPELRVLVRRADVLCPDIVGILRQCPRMGR